MTPIVTRNIQNNTAYWMYIFSQAKHPKIVLFCVYTSSRSKDNNRKYPCTHTGTDNKDTNFKVTVATEEKGREKDCRTAT